MFLFKYQSKHVRLPHHCPLHFAKENHKSCSSRNHAILISSSAFRKKQTHRFAGPTRVNMVRPRDMLCYVLTSQKRPPACGMLEVRTNLRTFPRSERKEGRPYWTRWPKLLMGVHIFPLEAGGPPPASLAATTFFRTSNISSDLRRSRRHGAFYSRSSTPSG